MSVARRRNCRSEASRLAIADSADSSPRRIVRSKPCVCKTAEVSGVRNSWAATVRNSSRARTASSASSSRRPFSMLNAARFASSSASSASSRS